MAQLELQDVSKIYRVGDNQLTAMNRVSLRVEEGDFISIVGHSGSGKTTLVSVIGGILRPSTGRVLFEQDDICAMDDAQLSAYRSRKIGFMFQFASLLPMLTARENVMLAALFGRERSTEEQQRADHLLELVGIGDRAGAYPGELSGGQQRRVAIARALMNSPRLILADEPTGDLDEETEAEIMALLNKINREQRVTMLLITHNGALARTAGRMLRMRQGTLLTVA
ncbi:ABC transporter ATP-binding protein [Desulfurivibrio alkaliphilus]|uniref:ABC transporter related protein n=1 Tax=Desulfurivibrio alkaliphilus (strain DSM 19089 / UNIQEM U267 / AHT2) TaxID=589865 RepID=D6YZY6_DESAT|nr:ABC transporter ATP-binding protein [Desulfurivibrio alkaliphilus]ADH85143.1 ABC transporter related protein [Desulfurivibrio alkaliphilus AHT 2]